MKKINFIVSIIFMIMICIPILNFNFQEDAVSEIDNRKLKSNPFINKKGDLTKNIEEYVNDRIGYRSEMITAYTVLNDKVFGKMVHPSYVYGKNGYVFGAGLTTVSNSYSEYHTYFAEMIKKIQDYCEQRDIPFLFVFNPAKPAVLNSYVPDGYNYDRSWVDKFLEILDEYKINYVDNTVTLREETEKGNIVFNQKYDANHWNDLGAFYGVNAMLNNLKLRMNNIHINDMNEFNITENLQQSLPVSKFPIKEMVPSFVYKQNNIKSIGDIYSSELNLNPSYKTFGYYENSKRKDENAPRALVFQGSYMNGFGYKYLANSFSEYIHVHDYQNILEFLYYFNIFQPDCVIFEVAEYTFSNGYFDFEKMKTFDLSPQSNKIGERGQKVEQLDRKNIKIERGNRLTKILWNTDITGKYAWIILDKEYDMKKVKEGYEITVKNEVYDNSKDKLQIIIDDGECLIEYKS